MTKFNEFHQLKDFPSDWSERKGSVGNKFTLGKAQISKDLLVWQAENQPASPLATIYLRIPYVFYQNRVCQPASPELINYKLFQPGNFSPIGVKTAFQVLI